MTNFNNKEIEAITTEYENKIKKILEEKKDDPKYRDLIEEHDRLKDESMAGLEAAGGHGEVITPSDEKAIAEAFRKAMRVGAIENQLSDLYDAETK